QQIVGRCNRVVNEQNPIVDARLADGSRVNAVIAPIALDGPILTIRQFPDEPITMEKLIRAGSISAEAAEYLRVLVAAGYSMIIGGGTSAGKTTFLNALSNAIPKDERIITIEDNAELQIQGIGNLVRLEAKNANTDGGKSITIRDCIKSALRMRPDRIIVGEVRSSEALDMLQAFNTGHDGSLCTIHANSCADMISRLEVMTIMGVSLPLEAIRGQIASGADVLVHLGRLRDRSRRVLEIAEVIGMRDGQVELNTLYRFDDAEGVFRKTGRLKNTLKLERRGLTLPEY
ncbi:MAG: ATPase, T2SS/T4P/T4SS family, partial [Lachnospiraceae bacterium]|nr:ATPase, T2SS/T4P/T4SS family [Lachnospiraceae bacterium]